MFGYFSKPSFSKHSKSFQTIIVNGRYVVSDEMSYWIYGCYQEFLMKRQFPAFVMYLTVPCDMVDVNVHPNKLEVKFANQGIIKKLVTDAVRSKIIDGVRIAKELSADDVNLSGFTITQDTYKEESAVKGEEFFLPFDENVGGFSLKDESKDHDIPNVIISDETAAIENEKLKDSADVHFSDMVGNPLFNSIADLSKTSGIKPQENAEIIEEKPLFFGKSGLQESLGIGADIKYSGKIFNTYLIFENGKDVFFIDQHAAHERIMYDKLEKEFNSGAVAVQNLLIPYTFNVLIDEKATLESKLDELEKCGFGITPYGGNTYALRFVPTRCGELDFSGFVSTLIHDVTQRGVVDDFAIFKDKIMQNACKSAIKGEDDISKDEILKLVSDIAKTDAVLFCPHGRPIVVKISKSEVEKWFKRIV
jgi:DNA mismatch repair protein MutL